MFEPSWTLQIGEQNINGTGVIGARRPPDDLIDLFAATMNGTQLVVLPKEGKIMQNLRTLWEGARGKLIWSRRIMLEISGSGAPRKECMCYRIGLEIGDKRIGYQLFEDGRVEEGLG